MLGDVSSGVSLGWYLLIQLSAVLVPAVVALILAWRPIQRAREKRALHEKRVEETCNAVIGEEADPTVGRYVRTKGLKELVPELSATIGRRNGKTVFEHIDAIEEHLGIGDHK